MSGHAFHRIAAIDRAAAPPVPAPLLFARIGGKYDALRVNSERAEEADPELMGRPHIEHPRDADSLLAPNGWRREKPACDHIPQCSDAHAYPPRSVCLRGSSPRRP